jgi:hypothetical protein
MTKVILNSILSFSRRRQAIRAPYARLLATSKAPLSNSRIYGIFTPLPALFVQNSTRKKYTVILCKIKFQTVFCGFRVEDKVLELRSRNY